MSSANEINAQSRIQSVDAGGNNFDGISYSNLVNRIVNRFRIILLQFRTLVERFLKIKLLAYNDTLD